MVLSPGGCVMVYYLLEDRDIIIAPQTTVQLAEGSASRRDHYHSPTTGPRSLV